MRAAVIAYTVNGAILAEKLRHLSDDETDIYVSAKSAKYIDAENIITFKSTPALIRDIFYQYEGIIFIGAAAIAVRSIAPYITSKFKDPAVLVMDDHAIHVISLLSGHVGGGNEWCVKVAGMFGSDAVITTATDVNNAFAVDVFAVKNHLKMINPYMIRDISTRIVNGEQLGIYMQAEEYEKVIQNECKKYSNTIKRIEKSEQQRKKTQKKKYKKTKKKECKKYRKNIKITDYENADIVILKNKSEIKDMQSKIILIPRNIVVGVGCRRGTEYLKIKSSVMTILEKAGVSAENVNCVASINKKADEKGIIELAEELQADFITYTADELMEVEGEFEPSMTVYNHVGADNVCGRSACRASCNGECLIPKTVENGVTVSVYRYRVYGG